MSEAVYRMEEVSGSMVTNAVSGWNRDEVKKHGAPRSHSAWRTCMTTTCTADGDADGRRKVNLPAHAWLSDHTRPRATNETPLNETSASVRLPKDKCEVCTAISIAQPFVRSRTVGKRAFAAPTLPSSIRTTPAATLLRAHLGLVSASAGEKTSPWRSTSTPLPRRPPPALLRLC